MGSHAYLVSGYYCSFYLFGRDAFGFDLPQLSICGSCEALFRLRLLSIYYYKAVCYSTLTLCCHYIVGVDAVPPAQKTVGQARCLRAC